MLMRSLLPARLSSAFHTSSPLLAKGWKIDWPKKLDCCPHMKSASRSLSAMTMTFSGLADALSASGAAVTPAGGPAANALVALPETRAATTSWPLGRKPSRRLDGVGHHREALRGQQTRLALVWISGSKVSLEPGQRLQTTGGGHVDAVEMRGDHVLGHARVVESEDRDVLRGRFALARADHQAALQVGDHLVGLELHAPGGEQRLEVRGLVGGELRHRIVGIVARLVGLRVRIDERQHAAAAHRELIDGIQRRGRQVLGVHQHQHVDVRVDAGDRRIDGAHRVQLFDLGIDHQRRARPPGAHVEFAAHGQRRQPADHRLCARSTACARAWRRRTRAARRASGRGTGSLPCRRWSWCPRGRGRASRRRR